MQKSVTKVSIRRTNVGCIALLFELNLCPSCLSNYYLLPTAYCAPHDSCMLTLIRDICERHKRVIIVASLDSLDFERSALITMIS